MKYLIPLMILLTSFNALAIVNESWDDPPAGPWDGPLQLGLILISTSTIVLIPTAFIMNGEVNFSDEETVSLIEVQASQIINGEDIDSSENIISALAQTLNTTTYEMANAVIEIFENDNELTIESLEARFGEKLQRK